MIKYFQKLGSRIEKEWLRLGQDERAFTDLACQHLTDDPPAAQVGSREVIKWIFGEVPSTLQPPIDPFGNPPVTLYTGRMFHIDALFWLDGTTSIHQHAFGGAFTLIEGSSVHGRWSFEESKRFSSRFRTGKLSLESTEILHVGDVRPIRAGPSSIHQLFHLDAPSVTVVVRTDSEKDQMPQWSYLRPSIALDAFHIDPLLDRRLALLLGMHQTGMANLKIFSRRLLSRDLLTVYKTLSLLAGQKLKPGTYEALCGAARKHHGKVVDLIVRSVESERRDWKIIKLRRKFHKREHRFLLAMLLLERDYTTICRLVSGEFPGDDAEELIYNWLCEMGAMGRRGFEFKQLDAVILAGLREKLTPQAIARWIQSQPLPEGAETIRPRDIVERCRGLKASPLLSPLLAKTNPPRAHSSRRRKAAG